MANHINHQQAKQGIQQAIERRRYNSSLEGSLNNTIQNTLRQKIGLDTLQKDQESIAKRLQENAKMVQNEEYVDPKEYDSLIADAQKIGERLGYYRNYIRNASPDNADAIKSATEMSQAFLDASKSMGQQQAFFSNFKDANDYKTQMDAYKEQQRLTFDYDLDAAKRKLDSYKAAGADKKNSFKDEYEALKDEYELAKYYQTAYGYDKLAENEDFEKKSKKANSTWDNGETARAADYINGKWYSKAGDAVSEFVDMINIFANDERVDDYNRYDLMTKDQVKTFNYIYNTQGQKKAQAYLDFIEGELAQKYAEKNKTSNVFINTLRALNAGTESLGEGLENLGLGLVKEGANLVTGGKTGSFGKGIDNLIKENAQASNSAMALAARKNEAGKLENFVYDLAQTTPTTLVNIIPGGFAVSSLSAAGNAYADATAEGKNSMQRIFMAIGEGSMEALTNLAQAKLGGEWLDNKIEGFVKNMGTTLGKSVAGNFIKYGYNSLSEGLEEAIQEISGTALRNVIYGEENKINWGDVTYAALLGATSAGILRSPELVNNVYSDIKLPPPTAENFKETFDTARDANLSERFSTFTSNLEQQDTLMSAAAIANVIEGNNDKAVKLIDDQIETYKYAKEYAKQKIEVKSDHFDAQVSMLNTMKKLIENGKFNAEAARNATMQGTTLWQVAAENNDSAAKVLLQDGLSNAQIEKTVLTDKGIQKGFERLTGVNLSQYKTVSQKRNAVKVTAQAYQAFASSDAAAQVTEILKANNSQSDATVRSENRVKAQKILEAAYKEASAEDSLARKNGDINGAKVAQAKMKLIDKVKNDVRNGKALSFASLDGSVAVNNARKYTEKASRVAPKNTSMAVERDIENAERIVGDEYVKMFDGALSKSGSFNEAEKTLLDDIESRIKYAEDEEKNELIEQRKKLKEYISLKKSAHEETLDLMKQYGREEFQKRAVRFQKTLKQYGIDLEVENGGELYYDENKNLITEEKYNELRKQGKKTSVVLQNGIHTERTIKIFDALAFGRYIRTLDFETGEIVLRRSGLDFNAREGVDFVVGHELVHEGETVNSGIVKTILDSVANTRLDSYYEIGKRRAGKKTSAEADKHWNNLKELYIKAETKNGDRANAEAKVTDAYMYEEIAADYMGMLLAETGSFDAVASKGGFLTKIKTVMKSLISRLKGDKLDVRAERVKELMKKLDDIVKSNYGKQAKTAGNAQKSTETNEKVEDEQTVTEQKKRAEDGERMMVVGTDSETADLSALELAKLRIERGIPANQVRKYLGWWQGKDGKWRYEISDQDMDFRAEGFVKNPKTLGDYVKHDELFKAYPELRNMRLKFEDSIPGSATLNGVYNSKNKEITLKSGRSKTDTEKTLIHEIQHAVQNIEGFARGASLSEGAALVFNDTFERVKDDAAFRRLTKPEEKLRYIIKEAEKRSGISFEKLARDTYDSAYGEIEANATSARRDMTKEQLREVQYFNDGVVFEDARTKRKYIDNLVEMGYTKRKANEMANGGVLNGIQQENVAESSAKRNADDADRGTGERSGRIVAQNLLEKSGSQGAIYRSNEISDSDAVANNKSRTADREGLYRVKYSVTSDSDGRQLTEAQQEFFKDSKVRDADGNLLVMYHGTPNAGFTKFREGTYFTEHKWYAERYKERSASSLSYKKTADNPDVYAVYLNMKKPFDTRNPEEAGIFYDEYYGHYGMGTPLMESGLPDWLDGRDLQEFLEEQGYDYDGLILDEGSVGGYGDEVVNRGLSYVIFSPEQVKNVDNANPTSDPDIRYSLSEETDTEYLSAVESGDMETAQRMVDEAAKAAGYSSRMYHGAKNSGGFTVFRDWGYFTENKAYAERYAQRENEKSFYEVYVKIEKPFDTRDTEAREIFENEILPEYGASQIQESGLPDWTDGYDIADHIDENGLDYDAIVLDEGGDLVNGVPVSRGLSYVIKDSAQVKSADPVTYDDNRNVIPLSERFNEKNEDIRFGLSGYTADGIEVYETSEEILSLPWRERKKRYLSFIEKQYRGRTAKFERNGHVYYAEFDRQNASKAIFGDSRSDDAGRDALINVGADGDIFELVENSTYDGSGKDKKKHNNTDYFDYFVKTVQIDDKVFDLLADVKKQYGKDGGFVYTIRLVENKNIKASPIQRGQALLDNSGNALIDDTIVTQDNGVVNTQSMQNSENDTEGRNSVSEAVETDEPSYDELKRQLDKLQKRNLELASELVRTHGKVVDRRSAMKLLDDIIGKYQGTIKAKDILAKFEDTFAYVNTKGATVDALMEKLNDIATDIFDSAIEYDESFKEYSELLTDLRTTGITVSEQDRGGDFDDVGGWNEFRKKNFGSIKFVNDGIVMIDSKYQELATKYPEWFDDSITHPAEQAKEIASVARRMRETGITPHDVYEGVDGQIVVNGIIGDLYSALKTADRKATFADKAAQKVDDAYLAEKMHYGAKIAELKRKSEMRERKIVEAFSTRMHKLKKDHHKAYQEKMVRSRVKDLAKRAARPTKTKHVPEGMRGDLLKFLSKITWEEGTIARSDYASEMRTLLADAPEHFTDENDIDGVNTFSEDLLKDMRDFSSNETVEKMTAKQAYELNVLLMRMIHEINDADKIFHSTAKASTLATKAIAQFNSNRKEREYVGSSLVEFIKYGATDPEAFFNVLGIPVLTEAYHNLAKRQDVFARTLRDLTNDMAEITGGEVPKSWREEVHEYTLASGEKVRLTPVQKMTLYLLSKQEASKKRLLSERGGIVPTDTKREFVWHTKENGKEKIKLSVPKTLLGKLAHLTEGDITTLVGTLDDKQIDMANKISELLNGKCAELGNEVSLAEEGYRKFIVDNYFPMMVAETGRTYEQLANSAKEQIAHKSFTKDRTGTADVPLVVEDIFSVMDRHLLGIAQYYAYDEALRDFQRILRLRPEGQGSLELTMKGYFGNKGNRVNNFLSNFIKDVQGAQMNIGEESLISEKVLSTYKAAQVAGNLSVVAKQPTAIFRAMPEFSAKGIAAMMNFATTKEDIKAMIENSGLAQLKNWGFSENTTAKSVAELYDKNATNWRGKLDDIFSWGAEKADRITWAAIWRAAKAETKTIEEATAKFNDAIRKTQVVKSAFTSSRITEQSGLTKLAFAFKNEPLKTFNYIRSTINDVAEGKEGAKKKAFAVTVATAINTAVVAAISAGFSLIRDDEEDSAELFAEKFKENVIADLISNSTILLGDIWTAVESAMNGREVERMDLAVFTDATQFARNFIDMFKKPESEQKNTWMKIFYDGARTVSNFTGIPIGNVIRAFKSVHGRVVEMSDDPVERYNMTKIWYNVEGVDNAAIRSKFRSILTDALDEGNYKAFAEINNDLRRHGFSTSDIEKAVSNSARLYNAWNNGAEAFRSEVNKAIKVAPMLSSTYIMEAFKSKKTALVNDLYDAMKSGSKKATNDAMSALLKHRDVDTKRVLTESDIDKLVTKKIENSIKNEVKSRLADLYGTESYDNVKKKILNEYRHFEVITSDYIDELARSLS